MLIVKGGYWIAPSKLVSLHAITRVVQIINQCLLMPIIAIHGIIYVPM